MICTKNRLFISLTNSNCLDEFFNNTVGFTKQSIQASL